MEEPEEREDRHRCLKDGVEEQKQREDPEYDWTKEEFVVSLARQLDKEER